MVVVLLVAWRLFSPDLAGALLIFIIGGLLLVACFQVGWPERDVTAIGCDDTGWWLNQRGKRVRVEWRAGSWRRRDLVVLRWSIWPWHALTLRSGSFSSEGEFRRFRARLYGLF